MQEIEFKKDLDEMNDAELRATLREFRSKYDEAKTEYSEFQEKVSEYKEEVKQAEEKAEIVDEIHPEFASMFAEMKDLNEEMVAEKFSTDELVEELKEAEVFSLPVDEVETDEEEEPNFNNKEQKSKNVEGEDSKYGDRIDSFFKERKMVKQY